MADLAAQIREFVGQVRSPVAILETPEPLTEAEFAELMARFKAAQPRPHEEIKVIPRSLIDRVGAALLAVLEEHPAVDDGSGDLGLVVCKTCCGAPESWERIALPWPCPTVREVAEKLGIEVAA